jgi:hypothetical protein
MRKSDERDCPTSCWNKAHEYERLFVLQAAEAI